MSKLTWNVSTEVAQLVDRLDRLTAEDHQSATVDCDGDSWLRMLDRLQAVVTNERHEAAQALVKLGY